MTDHQQQKRQKITNSCSQTANESGGAEEVGDQESGIEGFPVEVIGNILSHVANVKDVVRASWTCRKWRVALRHYLHTLHTLQHHESKFLPAFQRSRTEQLEFLLTDTLLQTMRLQSLHILHMTKFSATAVIAWLLHTGDSLRHLTYEVPMSTLYVDMLERCGRMRCLESLHLRYATIRFTADPTTQRFLCLLSLTLSNMIDVTTLQLQSLVSTCRKLESFSLATSIVTSTDPQWTLNLTSSSLKSFFLDGMYFDSVKLEANLLKALRLRDSMFTNFKLQKGTRLSSLRIDNIMIVDDLDLGNSTNYFLDLEEMEVRRSCVNVWDVIDHVFSNPSSKLRKLELIRRATTVCYPVLPLNVETIARLFPRLDRLHLSDEVLDISTTTAGNQLQGPTIFEKLRFLELHCLRSHEAILLVIDGALKRCPNLIQLVVACHNGSQFALDFMTPFAKLVRQFSHVNISFKSTVP